jgi:hypothetical protein
MTTVTGSTLVLYRTEAAATLLTTLASAGVERGALHAPGPALHGSRGAEIADTVGAVASSRGVEAMVWDGDAPADPAGVHRLVRDTRATLLVVEWQPRMVDGHLDLARQVLEDPPCDILMVRPGGLSRIETISVALGPGPNAPLVGGLARRWSETFGVPALALRGVEHEDEVAEARALCERLAPGVPAEIPVGRDLVNLLVSAAHRSGFLALGATEGFPLDRLGVRTVGSRLAQRADATIVVARRVDTP